MDFYTKILGILALLVIIILAFETVGFGIMNVVSNSMNHDLHNRELFLEFWSAKGFDESEVDSFPLPNGFHGGDLLIYKNTNKLETGDVGAYHSTCSGCADDVTQSRRCRLCTTIVVHRVLGINSTHFFFKPDNFLSDNLAKFSEETTSRNLVFGKVLFTIPKIGLINSMMNCELRNLKGDDCSLSACFNKGDCN